MNSLYMKNVFKEVKDGTMFIVRHIDSFQLAICKSRRIVGVFFHKRTLKIAQCKLGGRNR